MLYIISGKINSGKSTNCFKEIKELISQGHLFNGWITLPYLDNDLKSGHDLVIIKNSVIEKPIPFSRLEPFTNSIEIGKYYLDTIVIDKVLKTIPIEGNFIIDEIGRLEIEKKQGFYPVIEKVLKETKNQIFVVQESILETFLEKYKSYKPNIIQNLKEFRGHNT